MPPVRPNLPNTPSVPTVPTVPNVPIAGQTQQQLLTQQQWQAHKLRGLLEKEQAEMQQAADKPLRRIQQRSITKGSLISFQYIKLPENKGWHHDPYPLALCTSVYHDGKVAGVNLHYLTFNYIKFLIKTYCGKQFSYPQIKGNLFIKNSFRTYLPQGVRMLKMLDCSYLMTILGAVRSFKPSEVEAIRKFVQEQLRKKMNPSADDLSKDFHNIVHNDPRHSVYTQAKPPYNLPPLYGPPYHWIPKPTRGHGSKLPETEYPGGTI